MILKGIQYVLGSKPAGEGSELTEYDKQKYIRDKMFKEFKPMKGYKKFKKMYQENSKSRKVMGDIT